MRITFLLFSVVLAFAACKNDSEANQNAEDASATKAEPETKCYIMLTGSDTTRVQLAKEPNGEYTGEMEWLPKEKDGAVGTLEGKEENGRLVARWNYTIEGSNQAEEVHFTFDNGRLVRHTYDLEEKDGVLRPVNPDRPKRTEYFAEVPCK